MAFELDTELKKMGRVERRHRREAAANDALWQRIAQEYHRLSPSTKELVGISDDEVAARKISGKEETRVVRIVFAEVMTRSPNMRVAAYRLGLSFAKARELEKKVFG